MDKFLFAAFTSEAVPQKTHSAIGIHSRKQQTRIRRHKTLYAVEKQADIVQVFYHFSGDDDVKGLIKRQLFKFLKIGPVQIVCSVRGQDFDPRLIEVKAV